MEIPVEKIFLLVLLCFGVRTRGSASVVKTRTLDRHRRWIWGGCGLIPYCDNCQSSHLCVKCERGYVFIQYHSTSSTKIVQCTKRCPMGYKIKNKLKHNGPTCIYTNRGCMVPHCAVCHPKRTSSCIKCSAGFYLFRPSVRDSTKCVRKCPRWCSATVQDDGTKQCTHSATECRDRVPNCERCLDKQWCRKCKGGYFTYYNSFNSTMDCVKACPPKYKQVKSEYFGQYCEKREERKKCQTIANCQYCPKKVSCKKCSKNYLKYKSTVLDDIHCVLTCPKGFGRKRKRCVPLRKRGCQDDFCMICKVGLYRVTRGLCRRRCPKGYYTVGTVRKLCIKCPRGCQKCIRSNKCVKCTKGFVKLRNKRETTCVAFCPPGYTKQRMKKHFKCQPVIL